MIRLLPIIAGISAFMNNTPIVALLIPYVNRWGKRNNIAVSKLLIPISYAAILGGTMTLVGTATNMLVNALAIDEADHAFSLFDFTIVGLPLAIVGLIYLFIFGKKLLPERKSTMDQFAESSMEYVVEAKIASKSSFIGKTIADANLRQLNGLFVVEIIRGEEVISPVSPETVLNTSDRLLLAGNVGAISELMENNNDLELPKSSQMDDDLNFDIVELVVSRNSYLVNRTVKDADFRRRYDSALVAINRGGERLIGKIGDKVLKTGDTLLALVGDGFKHNLDARRDFYTVSKLKEVRPLDMNKSLLILIGLIAALTLSATGVLPLFTGLMVLLAVVLALKVASLRQLRDLFDYNLLIIAALAIAIGQAVQNTGLADYVAEHLLTFTKPAGVLGALIALYLITMAFTELMTNVAAATITVPLAIATASGLAAPMAPFLLVVAFAASASFMTPIGYQTNLMVFGPGGYKFKDFMKIGLPLSIIYFVLTIGILYWYFF